MSFCNNNGSGNQSLTHHLCEFIGETVTIFTTSGGISGCGFTGLLLAVNCNFVRLMTQQGTAPANPLSESICGDLEGGCAGLGGLGMGSAKGPGGPGGYKPFSVGSVCDIPIDRIAAFCHNAV